MSVLAKYWKALLALVMVVAAVPVVFLVYLPQKETYEAEERRLNSSISTLQQTIQENLRFADIQDSLPGAREALEASRQELYEHFPVELKEEDQIMYILYLEELFGTEITFSFGSAAGIVPLSDGAVLGGVTLTVNYETSYQGYKDMIKYLATDERVTSIQYSTMTYDTASDTVTGSLTLQCYVLTSDLLEYQSPDVTVPDTGKDNIFD